MNYTSAIVNLYNSVHEDQKRKFRVNHQNIRKAFVDMKEAYLPNPDWQLDFSNKKADYNDPAHRCAYLHKYAMVHTGLLCKVLQSALTKQSIQNDINSKRKLNLCSLGGGPGTDIVSLLFVIKEIFGFIQCRVDVIDFAQEWKNVFDSIVSELRTGKYGSVKDMVSSGYFGYDYLSADLLNASYWSQYKVLTAVRNADIITMVKFISAAACDKTRLMVTKIFQNMKGGGMLLFVDNAAGGFHEMLQEVAASCGMQSVYGPVMHYDYEEPSFSRKLHGYTSQSKTKVSIQMWKKSEKSIYNTTQQLRREYIHTGGRSIPTSNVRLEYINTARRSIPTNNVRLNNRPQPQALQDSGCCSII